MPMGSPAESGHCDVLVCDVAGLAADLAAVETVARLRLLARRLGCTPRFQGVSRELEALLGLCGLTADGLLPLDAGGEPEEGEQALGIEEGADRPDPSL
jgi:hypothetical protein